MSRINPNWCESETNQKLIPTCAIQVWKWFNLNTDWMNFDIYDIDVLLLSAYYWHLRFNLVAYI